MAHIQQTAEVDADSQPVWEIAGGEVLESLRQRLEA